MQFLRFICAASILGAVLAAAVPLSGRNCPSIPSSADPNVLLQVYRIALSLGVNNKVMLATFETGWIESHFNNLPCGDQDSIGVFQQRPSQGWGTFDQIMNIDYSTRKFLEFAIPNDRNNPGFTAGQLAQSVQRSEFPDRYDQAEGTARNLWNQAISLNGGGPGGNPGGGCAGLSAWSSSAIYVGGQSVSYNGHKWTAKWWTQSDTPGGPAGVWADNGTC